MTNQRGSILIALLAALGVVMTLGVVTLQQLQAELKHLKRKQVVAEGGYIVDAVRNYYVDSGKRWPRSIDSLVREGYLEDTGSPYGSEWELVSTRIGMDVRLEAIDEPNAGVIAGMMPLATHTENRVILTIVTPGDEAIHTLFYKRDGTRALTGDLNAADNTLEDFDAATYK